MKTKTKLGQFFTSKCEYILEGFELPSKKVRCILEPFTGEGHLIEWVRKGIETIDIECYDIDPKYDGTVYRDTLRNPPNYENTWIITNPPFLARNKNKEKDLYEKYRTNDLYKCFLWSLIQQNNCYGGVLILPSGFFLSPRDIDERCRAEFLKRFQITKIKYFEESVFEDTNTTIVAFQFIRSVEPLSLQNIPWVFLPSNEEKTFEITSQNKWIVGGDIYNLPTNPNIRISRHVEGCPLTSGEQQTFLFLKALDSGKEGGRISLEYKVNYIYPAKETSRSYATLRIKGLILSSDDQIQVASRFNEFIQQKRKETNSLFLPQFRESKEYARKRIPFTLAYHIISHLLSI